MAISDLENSQGPVGPLKDKRSINVSALTDDFVEDRGFIIEVVTPGAGTASLTYETMGGRELTEAGLKAGDEINVAGIPVLCRRIDQASTVTTVNIGLL